MLYISKTSGYLKISSIKISKECGSEAAARRCSVKKVLLEISQNAQESTCARVSFLIMLQTEACNFIKKRLRHRCLPVNFVKFIRKPFLTKHLRLQLLEDMIIPQRKKNSEYKPLTNGASETFTIFSWSFHNYFISNKEKVIPTYNKQLISM